MKCTAAVLIASVLALAGCDPRSNQPVTTSAPIPSQLEIERAATVERLRKEAKAAEAALLKWHEDSYIHLTDGQRYAALSVESLNTVQFGFPFEGDQRATLQLRGPMQSVVLSLPKALFVCLPDCRLPSKLDIGIGGRLEALPAVDGSTNYLSIYPYGDCLVTKLAKANTISITAIFYQEGAKTFDFDISGLNNWPNMIPKKTIGCD